MKSGFHTAGLCCVAVAAALGCARSAGAADRAGWHDPEATLRMRVSTGAGPSHPSGGYIATLPTGGILPNGPATVVIGENGKPLKHGVLWYDPGLAMALVMEQPPFGGVYVYFKPGNVQRWTPESGLHPSVVVFTRTGGANLAAAQQLAAALPGRGVHFSQNPLGLRLGGNPAGVGGPFADYLLGYMVSTDPGKTFLAPMVWNGGLSFLLDGKAVALEKASDLQGGAGQWFDLTREPRRVEWFHVHTGGQPSVQVMWRRPNATPTELGAQTPTNKPPWFVGMMPGNAFIQSGRATASEVQARDADTPVAAFTMNPAEYFWFEDKDPLIRYELAVLPGNPAKTTYTWTFGPGLQVSNRADVTWLLVTGRRSSIGLTASAGGKTSTCQYQFDPFCEGENGSNINDPDTRNRYRDALSFMLDACPAEQNVFSEWSPTMWDLFWRLVEPGPDKALAHIFAKRWDAAKKALPSENRYRLQDLFIPMASAMDPKKALEWVERFEKDEKELERRQALTLKKAELYMYYLGNLPEAEKLAAKVAAVFTSPYRNAAAIRLADIAFLRGDSDAAIRLYGEVQKRVKHAEQVADKKDRLDKAASGGGLARSKEDLKAQRAPKINSATIGSLRNIKDWRIGAVRDTAVTETARNLLRQGYLSEAKKNLEQWETEFPLSKISGDYIVVEADFLMRTKDFIRANASLTAYCKNVDMTSYLAEAMQLKLECMKQLKSPPQEMKPFLEDIKKRLPTTPLGETASSMLAAMKE